MLVCRRHHVLLHVEGLQFELHPDRRLAVRTADGVPEQHHPAQPWATPSFSGGCGRRVPAATLPDHSTDRLDLRYAVGVLVAQVS